MARFEDPHSGKAKLYEDLKLFQVRVSSRKRPFLTVFLCFWLCMWAVAEITVLAVLISPGTDARLFLIAWLGAWTLAGGLTLSQVFWNLFGYELLSITDQELVLSRHVPFLLRRSWAYDVKHVSNFRTNPAGAHKSLFNQRADSIFSSRRAGMIQFDYGLKTRAFGLALDEAESRVIVEKIVAHLKSS